MVALVERSTWEEARKEYEIGNYKTLKELAERCKVDYQCLRQRIYTERWKDALLTRNDKVLQSMQEVKEDLASQYLSRTFKRAEKYEKMIEASQAMQSTTNEGVPLLDVDAIVAYSKAELNIHALAKSALRISDKVDVTSGGQSIGDSFVTAIQKLREDANTPKLTSEQVTQVIEAEIID